MPYISLKDRIRIAEEVDEGGPIPTTAGELNYCLTCLVLDYFKRNGGRYQQINDIVGALEGCKLEFYRRVAAPYEDTKIKENGDVN